MSRRPRYALAMSDEALDLVIFDLDGTLVDSLPDIAAALNHALATHGLQVQPTEVVATLVGDGILALAERALELQNNKSVSAHDLSQSIWHRYLTQPCVLTKTYEGIVQALETLKQRGIPVAVLTNKPGDVARLVLAALNLSEGFMAVIGDGDGFPRKPAPAALANLMALANARPERTLMVGDGVPDVQVAKAAGCIAVAALWGYSRRAVLLEQQPNFAVMSPWQILDLP